MEIDVGFNNSMGVYNTRLLKLYGMSTADMRRSVLGLKLWAKHRDLAQARWGTLSSYSWVVIGIWAAQRAGLSPNFQSRAGTAMLYEASSNVGLSSDRVMPRHQAKCLTRDKVRFARALKAVKQSQKKGIPVAERYTAKEAAKDSLIVHRNVFRAPFPDDDWDKASDMVPHLRSSWATEPGAVCSTPLAMLRFTAEVMTLHCSALGYTASIRGEVPGAAPGAGGGLQLHATRWSPLSMACARTLVAHSFGDEGDRALLPRDTECPESCMTSDFLSVLPDMDGGGGMSPRDMLRDSLTRAACGWEGTVRGRYRLSLEDPLEQGRDLNSVLQDDGHTRIMADFVRVLALTSEADATMLACPDGESQKVLAAALPAALTARPAGGWAADTAFWEVCRLLRKGHLAEAKACFKGAMRAGGTAQAAAAAAAAAPGMPASARPPAPGDRAGRAVGTAEAADADSDSHGGAGSGKKTRGRRSRRGRDHAGRGDRGGRGGRGGHRGRGRGRGRRRGGRGGGGGGREKQAAGDSK